MEFFEFFGAILYLLGEILVVIVDDSGNKNARGKGKVPWEKYVTR
jgi:hypothetical protein